MPAPLPREIDAFISSLYGAASTGCRPTAHDLSLYIQMTGWPRSTYKKIDWHARLHIASKGMSMIMVQGPIITVPAPRAKSDRRNSNMSQFTTGSEDKEWQYANMYVPMFSVQLCLCAGGVSDQLPVFSVTLDRIYRTIKLCRNHVPSRRHPALNHHLHTTSAVSYRHGAIRVQGGNNWRNEEYYE
jgi:hypothetical protein